MIQLLGKLDRYKKYWVGVSGGIDSMVALHFLKQMRFDVKAFHVNHHTEACKQGHAFLMEALRGDFYTDCIYPLVKPKAQSWEEYWRKGRYDLFNSHLSKGREVITAHHLGDVIETWVHGSLHGQPKLIPYRHGSVIRPFLTTPKEELVRWAKNHYVPYIDDFTNDDTTKQRNYIRHEMMPHILAINPGIGSMLRKRILARPIDKIVNL